jgi:glyoxylase-like metal-dependent hydrolase (beta-lactamase superfamily II)
MLDPRAAPRSLDGRRLDRRAFLAGLGHGAVAIAVVSIAGCAPNVAPSAAPTGRATSGTGATPPGSTGPGATLPGGTPPGGTPPGGTPPGGSTPGTGTGVAWERVNLGFVSAYLLVRNGEAALVDTGVSGSADEILASLGTLGLGWGALSHVILTHRHGDHAGSADAVLAAAPGAAGYAGAEDIPGITSSRPLKAVGDGDSVFDLRIVAAPGHTAGSICVLDPVAGILVAGDAMGTSGGRPILPGAEFTADMALARQSIVKLGGLTFETLLVGHGNPIESGAAALVAELGAAG